MSGMLTEPQLDPFGALLTELRDDLDVGLLVGDRVRGSKPSPGDVRGPKDFVSFIVISALSVPIHPRVPVSWAEYGVRCYAPTFQAAWAIWGAVVKTLHVVGPRVKTSGLGIYRTAILTGGEEVEDPDTKQPYVEGTVQLIATAQVVT